MSRLVQIPQKNNKVGGSGYKLSKKNKAEAVLKHLTLKE